MNALFTLRLIVILLDKCYKILIELSYVSQRESLDIMFLLLMVIQDISSVFNEP